MLDPQRPCFHVKYLKPETHNKPKGGGAHRALPEAKATGHEPGAYTRARVIDGFPSVTLGPKTPKYVPPYSHWQFHYGPPDCASSLLLVRAYWGAVLSKQSVFAQLNKKNYKGENFPNRSPFHFLFSLALTVHHRRGAENPKMFIFFV